MNAPKRWYQLSVMQLLVAMAVVAAFYVVNTRTTTQPILWDASSTDDRDDEVVSVLKSAGWPFVYKEVVASVNEGNEFQITHWHYWVLNVSLALLITALVTLFAGNFAGALRSIDRSKPYPTANQVPKTELQSK